MELDADALYQRLRALPPAPALRVAYSGGVDSSVLLHLLASLREQLPPLSVIHVHHGLSPEADRWAEHCRKTCAALDLPLEVVAVDARPLQGESPEAAARRVRHAAFEDLLRPGEGLLTAHHRDDQAETLLLALMRGSGPAGLAAMPRWRPFGPGWLGRPLLDWGREDILLCARSLDLAWVDDPGNAEHHFDRNFLRHRVLPLLAERWPAADKRIAHAARLQAESLALHHELARLDFEQCSGLEPGTLNARALELLPPLRQRNLLRWWLQDKGLPLPSAGRIESIRRMLTARSDRQPVVAWPGAEVRYWHGHLYAFPPLPHFDATARHPWPPGTDISNPATGAHLYWSVLMQTLAGIEIPENGLTLGFRQGGERLRIHPAGPTRPLKDLMREAGIPPWMRGRIPLVWHGQRLLGVYGLWANHDQPNNNTGSTS